MDGCKVEVVLLPADEVSAPAQFSPGERVMGYVFCILKQNLVCTRELWLLSRNIHSLSIRSNYEYFPLDSGLLQVK